MGLRENARNARRLHEAAAKIELGAPLASFRLSAAETMSLAYLLGRFKHALAAEVVEAWFGEQQAKNPDFAEDAKAFANAMAGTAGSDFKAIKRPEAQSALDKLRV